MMTIDNQRVTNTVQSFTNTVQSFRLKIWNSLLFVCTFEGINEMKMINPLRPSAAKRIMSFL